MSPGPLRAQAQALTLQIALLVEWATSHLSPRSSHPLETVDSGSPGGLAKETECCFALS